MFIYRLNKALAAIVGIAALWLLFTGDHGWAFHYRLALLLYTSLLILIISGFAQNNLLGQERYLRFGVLLFCTSIGVYLTFASTNLLLIGVGWSASGAGAILLVNHANSHKSRLAAIEISRWFVISESSFWLALLLAHSYHVNLFAQASPNPDHGSLVINLISLLLLTSGVIRSGLFPAMRWLVLTVEAPSPLSALLHAGIVNGFGFLLVLFPIMHRVRYLIVVISLVTIVLALAVMTKKASWLMGQVCRWLSWLWKVFWEFPGLFYSTLLAMVVIRVGASLGLEERLFAVKMPFQFQRERRQLPQAHFYLPSPSWWLSGSPTSG